MTINLADNTPRVSYAVSQGATQTSFAVSFEFFDDADLNVYVDGTLKTITTHYTVSGGDGSTGTVTMSVTGATGGSTVVITRDIDLKRTTDFPASGSFQIGSLNTELDKLIAIAADLDDKASRALQLTDFDTAVSLVLPDVNTRKGKTLAFNASTGAVEAGPSTSDVQTVSATAADIATLADIEDGTDATDAIQTVAGIASNVTSVAAKASLITSDFVADLNTLAVTDVINDINTLATSDIVSDLNTLATSDIVSDLNTLATSDIVSDLNTLATSDIVSDINTLATSDIVTDLNLLATSDFVSDLNTMATTANVNNLSAVAGKVTEIGRLGTSDAVADLAILGTSDAVSDMNALAAISSDITTVADNISTISTKANAGANTDITSIKNTSLAIGRDDDNLIKFGTDNQIVFEVSGSDGVTFKASGEIEATSLDISGDADIDGTLEADAITVNGTALNTVIADEATALAIALG